VAPMAMNYRRRKLGGLDGKAWTGPATAVGCRPTEDVRKDRCEAGRARGEVLKAAGLSERAAAPATEMAGA
jgi:hypothetical protein